MKVFTDFWKNTISSMNLNPDKLDPISIRKVMENVEGKDVLPNLLNRKVPMVCVVYDISMGLSKNTHLFYTLFNYLKVYHCDFPIDDILNWYYCEECKLGLISYELTPDRVYIENHYDGLIYIFLHGDKYEIFIRSKTPRIMDQFINSGITSTKSKIITHEPDTYYKCIVRGLSITSKVMIMNCTVSTNTFWYANEYGDNKIEIKTNLFNPIRIYKEPWKDPIELDLRLPGPLNDSKIRDSKLLDNLYLKLHGDDPIYYVKNIKYCSAINADLTILYIGGSGYIFKDCNIEKVKKRSYF